VCNTKVSSLEASRHFLNFVLIYRLINLKKNKGEDVVEALGFEVDRLESEIQKLVPGVRHVDIEAHNPESIFN
jgi:hypothetical protein